MFMKCGRKAIQMCEMLFSFLIRNTSSFIPHLHITGNISVKKRKAGENKGHGHKTHLVTRMRLLNSDKTDIKVN